MTGFQRAHSDEQREIRRRAILDAAAAMLTEMPVAQISLNELSRRVGLAKSNVLRYFESREAVLLELLAAAGRDWLAGLDDLLKAAVDAGASPAARGDQVAAALADSLAVHPVLCELISAQAAVLEHNVSPQAVAKYKRIGVAQVGAFARALFRHLPELGEDGAGWFAGSTIMVVGTVWIHSRPAAAVLAAYEADPALAVLRPVFTSMLRETLEVLIAGVLARGRAGQEEA